MPGIPYALNFTLGASGSKVVCGTLGSANPAAMTFLMWYRPTSFGGGRGIAEKDSGSLGITIRQGGSSSIGFLNTFWGRAITNCNYISDSTSFVSHVNQPSFIAVVLDSAAAAGSIIKYYFGDLTTPAQLATNSTATDGLGAFNSLATYNLTWGTRTNGNSCFGGQIWAASYVPSALTLGDICQWQAKPFVLSGALGHYLMGANGTGLVLDQTGRGNNGTITAATPTSDYLPRVGRQRIA